jgi:hypothetical protein
MLDEIYEELFGDNFIETLKKAFEDYHIDKGEDEKKDENYHSYYHRICDKYDNGKCVSHKEKEVKDGEVIKDLNETYQIEDKKDKCCCDKSKGECNKKEETFDAKFYESKLKEASDLLEKAQKTIKQQQDLIDQFQQEKNILDNKLAKIKEIFG